MAKQKTAAEVARKWALVTPQRAEDFIAGVQNPSKSWEASTRAAEDNYKTGVTKAASEGRFGKGVAKAGDSKWQANTISKGRNRWGEGVSLAESTFQTGIGPVLETINRTVLPQRWPKGDPRNIKRVEAIAKALHDQKVKG